MNLTNIFRQSVFAVVMMSSAGYSSHEDRDPSLNNKTSIDLAYKAFTVGGYYEVKVGKDRSHLSKEAADLAAQIEQTDYDEFTVPRRDLHDLAKTQKIDCDAEFEKIIKAKANVWLDLAKKAELGQLPIVGCDFRAAAMMASRAVNLLTSTKRYAFSLEQKQFETSAILAAHYCLQASKAEKNDAEKLNWVWRGLIILPLQLDSEMIHSTTGPDCYKKAIELLESIRKPIQNFRAFCEISDWGQQSWCCTKFPLKLEEMSFMPGVVESNIIQSWHKISHLIRSYKKYNEKILSQDALASLKQEKASARTNALRATKVMLNTYKKGILDLKSEFSLAGDDSQNYAINRDELVLNDLFIKWTKKDEEGNKLHHSSLPFMLAELYKGARTAEFTMYSLLSFKDRVNQRTPSAEAQQHMKKVDKYAQKEAGVYLKLAKYAKEDSVFPQHPKAFFTLRAAHINFVNEQYEKAAELAQATLDKYGEENCRKIHWWYVNKDVLGYDVKGLSDVLGNAKSILERRKAEAPKAQ